MCRCGLVYCVVVEYMELRVLCWVGVLVGGMWVMVWVTVVIWIDRCELGSGLGWVSGWRCV